MADQQHYTTVHEHKRRIVGQSRTAPPPASKSHLARNAVIGAGIAYLGVRTGFAKKLAAGFLKSKAAKPAAAAPRAPGAYGLVRKGAR
jgi:hypothetical protein